MMMKSFKTLLIVFCAALLLSGCVQTDIGINFQDQTHGQILQKIQLSERIASLNSNVVDDWIQSLKRRVRRVNGYTKRVSNRELVVTIPFNNSADLEQKFNTFFNPIESKNNRKADELESELPQFSSHLSQTQNNWIFVLRNHLSLELDLKSLALVSTSDQVLINSGEILDLQFSLNTPWGAKIIDPQFDQDFTEALAVSENLDGKQIVWTLKPGEINKLEAIFWVPSPVGIGTILIILFIYLGFSLKYRLLPKTGIRKTAAPTEA